MSANPAYNLTIADNTTCQFGLKYWERGFDFSRFCRDDRNNYRTPTCCNYY